MNIEGFFSNEEQLARDARGVAEYLADGKMFDDISEEFEFKTGTLDEIGELVVDTANEETVECRTFLETFIEGASGLLVAFMFPHWLEHLGHAGTRCADCGIFNLD